jgi:hypothetical protein
MPTDRPVTILCLASYFKGTTFIEAAKRLGCRVLLLTREKLQGEDWPWPSIDEPFFMPDTSKQPDVTHAVAYLYRTQPFDRIVPLDDFDVETAASLREHLRIPGMGDTTARHFRDKLAMRVQARDEGILVPEFTPVVNNDQVVAWTERVRPPWVLKPRSQAGAMGIKKVHSADELWGWLDRLGDERSYHLLEQFVPGEVFHVDAIISERNVVFAVPHQYARPPMTVAHGGGVFISRTMDRNAKDAKALLALNKELMRALRMVRGVTHSEFIKAEDGRVYFLETAARVGGANIAELVEYATGLNLWAEWARIEAADARGEKYRLPKHRKGYAGVLICLAKQEYPDLSGYNDPEVVWRLHKKHHAGIIVAADNPDRIEELIWAYGERFAHDFLAVAPPLDRAPT